MDRIFFCYLPHWNRTKIPTESLLSHKKCGMDRCKKLTIGQNKFCWSTISVKKLMMLMGFFFVRSAVNWNQTTTLWCWKPCSWPKPSLKIGSVNKADCYYIETCSGSNLVLNIVYWCTTCAILAFTGEDGTSTIITLHPVTENPLHPP